MTRIARDVYPVLLAPSAEMIVAGPGLTFPVADVTIALDQVVESHPEHRRAVALLDDTGLRRSDLVVASALSVEPLSEIATPSSLMTAAVRRLRSVENPDAARLMGLVIELLGESRALADGRKTMVPAHIGFTALPLESGDGVALPQGTLRASTKSERRFVPFMLQAQAEAVLSTTVVCQPLESGQDTTAPQAEGQTALNRLAREVVLAAALSSSVDVPHSCPWVTWIVAHAVGRGSTSYRPLHPERAPGRVDPLTKGEIEALEHWASHVAGVDLQHVEIAVDRTLRAIWETERTDSLIDAVIAWENLVGTRNETTYRVTAALAVLCQDDLEKRIATRKDLALTYNARSRVVHGDPAPTDLHEHRSLAIQTALEALRRLMTERQDLLALASSDKRADRLLLGIRKNGP